MDAILAHPRGVISAATGSGKTTMMSRAIVKQFEAGAERVLVVVHTKALLAQMASRLSIETGKQVSVYYGDTKDDLGSSLVVATHQSLKRLVRHEAIDREHFNHVHVDEAHNARNPSYQLTVKYFHPQTLHGYTATLEGSGKEEIVSVFGPTIFRIGLLDLIDQGYLSRMRILVSVTQTGGVKNDEEYNRKKFDVIRRMTDENAEIVKTLHFYSLNRRFDLVRQWSLLRPDSYGTITGKMRPKDRQRILEQFQDPGSQLNHVLANRVLNEGIDLPITNSLVFHESMGDYRVITQRFGRGLRIWKPKPDQTTLIMIFVDSQDETQLKAVRSFIDGVEQEPGASDRVAVKEVDGSSVSSRVNPTTRKRPISITFVDVTERAFREATGGGKVDHIPLDEFVAIMVSHQVDSYPKYTSYRWKHGGPANPATYYQMSSRELWNMVRRRLGTPTQRRYSFTFEEFVAEMLRLGVHRRGEYSKIWRDTNFPFRPEKHLGLTSSEVWETIQHAAGERVIRTGFTREEFVEAMVAAGITTTTAFEQRKDDFDFPSGPYKRLGMTAEELFGCIRARMKRESGKHPYTVGEFVDAVATKGISSQAEYNRRRHELGFGADPHRKLKISSAELFRLVRKRTGVPQRPTYKYTVEEFVVAMSEAGVSSQTQYDQRRTEFTFGTDPHTKLKLRSRELWDMVRDEIASMSGIGKDLSKSA